MIWQSHPGWQGRPARQAGRAGRAGSPGAGLANCRPAGSARLAAWLTQTTGMVRSGRPASWPASLASPAVQPAWQSHPGWPGRPARRAGRAGRAGPPRAGLASCRPASRPGRAEENRRGIERESRGNRGGIEGESRGNRGGIEEAASWLTGLANPAGLASPAGRRSQASCLADADRQHGSVRPTACRPWLAWPSGQPGPASWPDGLANPAGLASPAGQPSPASRWAWPAQMSQTCHF